ncbi:unnamed protein product, partial [Eruca vesicaria subsp. sativa]|nr:unnamed protein product [Eruca vesicaria subsp. sativa]
MVPDLLFPNSIERRADSRANRRWCSFFLSPTPLVSRSQVNCRTLKLVPHRKLKLLPYRSAIYTLNSRSSKTIEIFSSSVIGLKWSFVFIHRFQRKLPHVVVQEEFAQAGEMNDEMVDLIIDMYQNNYDWMPSYDEEDTEVEEGGVKDTGAQSRKKKLLFQRSSEKYRELEEEMKWYLHGMCKASFTSSVLE